MVTLEGCTSETSNHGYVIGVGIKGLPDARKIKLYPAPNDGKFTISIELPRAESVKTTIYNNIRAKVFEIPDFTIHGSFSKTLDLHRFRMGSAQFYCKGNMIKQYKNLVLLGIPFKM
ncbi:MAG: hypothetical protein WCL00_13480 [Bacteroidota bacterium]